MNAPYETDIPREEATAPKVLRPVRPGFLMILLLTLLGCGAMKMLALYATKAVDPDFQIAVYRYYDHTVSDCLPWSGSAAMPVLANEEAERRWERLPLPPVNKITIGLCPVAAPMPM